MIKKASIKKNMITQFLILFLICAVLICFFFIPATLHISAGQQSDKILSNLNTCNTLALNCINNIVLTNSSLSKNPDIVSSLTGYSSKSAIEQLDTDTELYNTLYSSWFKSNEISDIKIYVSGKIYSSASNAVFDTVHAHNSEWYKALQTSSDITIISDFSDELLNTLRSQGYTLAVCSRIENSGNVLGYIKTALSTDYIYNRIFNTLRHPNSSEIFLMDNASKKIIGMPTTFANGELDGIIQQMSSGYGGYLTADINGSKYRIIYSDLNNQGLRCVEVIKTNELYSINQNSFAIFFLALIIFLLFATAGAFLIIRRISSSIRLSASANNGYYSELSEIVESVDALSKKTDSLTHMCKKLKHENNLLNLSAFSGRINPHFLYNTLDTIIWNLDDLDDLETARLLSSLSNFYRMLLKTSTFVCTLEDELKVSMLYMNLQKSCFNSNFNYTINVPPEISKLYIPSFILQPLIENSIIHGFENKKHNLQIIIEAEVTDDKLILTLKDNGHGIDIFTLNLLNDNDNSSSGHAGTKNIRKRIKLICGDKYDLEFYSEYTNGTIVKIILPIAYDTSDFDIDL